MPKLTQAQMDERLNKQVEIALKKICVYYQIGLTLLKQLPLNREQKQIYEPLNQDTQVKIKRFANPNKGYTPDQLEELLKLCRENKNPFPLSFKIIERLLSIPLAQRERLQREMVKKGWRRRELDHQIALLRPNSSWKGGRQVKRLPTAKSVLPELWHMSKEWTDRATSIGNKYPDALTELKEADRNRFTKATAMLQKLKRSLDVHLRKVQPRISKEKAPMPTPKGRQ